MAKTTNGRNAALRVMGAVILLGLTAWGGAVFTRSDDLKTHTKLPGHPVMVERVKTMHDTVNEIRADVKTLLRRTP